MNRAEQLIAEKGAVEAIMSIFDDDRWKPTCCYCRDVCDNTPTGAISKYLEEEVDD